MTDNGLGGYWMESVDFGALIARAFAGLDDVRACLLVSRDGLTLAAHPGSGEEIGRRAMSRLEAVGEAERGFLVVGEELWVVARRGPYTGIVVAGATGVAGLLLDRLESTLRAAEEARSQAGTSPTSRTEAVRRPRTPLHREPKTTPADATTDEALEQMARTVALPDAAATTAGPQASAAPPAAPPRAPVPPGPAAPQRSPEDAPEFDLVSGALADLSVESDRVAVEKAEAEKNAEAKARAEAEERAAIAEAKARAEEEARRKAEADAKAAAEKAAAEAKAKAEAEAKAAAERAAAEAKAKAEAEARAAAEKAAAEAKAAAEKAAERARMEAQAKIVAEKAQEMAKAEAEARANAQPAAPAPPPARDEPKQAPVQPHAGQQGPAPKGKERPDDDVDAIALAREFASLFDEPEPS